MVKNQKYIAHHIIFVMILDGVPLHAYYLTKALKGREFVNKINDAVCKEFDIKRSVTSAYHPQTNGLDERTNQTLKQRLSKLVNEHQNNWCDFLEEVAYSIRTQKQATTKYTPFYLMFGRHPNSPQMVIIWNILVKLINWNI
jgi:transposase InsO family protein